MAGPMLTSANYSATSAIVGPVTIPANLQPAATTFFTWRHDVALWWEKIFYKAFGSFISRTGQLMHACIVVEISFFLTGITISALMFIHGPGPNCVMLPPSSETKDAITLFPPGQVEVPRAELAAGPTSSASLDCQLAIMASSSSLSCLSRSGSAGFSTLDGSGSSVLSPAGLSSDESFFSSGTSLSSLSHTTSRRQQRANPGRGGDSSSV